jgi:hypothetical protein
MNIADLREIGSITVLDLEIISKSYGRDFLPYPFMFTQSPGVSSRSQYLDYASAVPERLHNGDLAAFKRCVMSYGDADIRVECHVQYIPADRPSIRVMAARHDQFGFLAKQRPDEDVIDLYELSPYLIGPAVADSVVLNKPGSRDEIVIPDYVPPPDNADPHDDLAIRSTIEHPTNATAVSRAEVSAYATVQSHWRPTRNWGMDIGKNAAVWVQIKDDGDYLYATDFSVAKPMAQAALAERIDHLITEDVKALRQFRGL